MIAALAVVTSTATAETVAERTVVVELFTSQSCYSCPPAEAYLAELADAPGIIALEFHVDYWDDLVYGSAGRWKDVFSDAAYTARQRTYARTMRRRSVYTPQMIVQGRDEVLGSDRRAIGKLIERTRTEAEAVQVVVQRSHAGTLEIHIAGDAPAPAEIVLVRFERQRTTEVRAGENKGKTLINRHAVVDMDVLDEWRGGTMRIDTRIDAIGPGQGCAVIVQARAQSPILGAALCPDLNT